MKYGTNLKVTVYPMYGRGPRGLAGPAMNIEIPSQEGRDPPVRGIIFAKET